MFNHFGHAAHARGNRDHLRSHGLQGHQPERFQLARQQQNVGDGQFFVDLLALAEKNHVIVNAFFYC